MQKTLSLILVFIMFLFCLAACTTDDYRYYHVTDMKAKSFISGCEDFDFKPHNVEMITDYEKYCAYRFNLDYTEEFFKNNNLLVFVVSCSTSDQMEYVELREKDGLLYPLFQRKKIGKNDPVTDDYILLSFCVEISKEFEYNAGEIIYIYK